jgi:hypothetical protein
VRFRLAREPMVVHACHCRWCQRETGSGFVVNAMIERSELEVDGVTEEVLTPSESGYGQRIHRCPRCRVALWSHYAGAGPAVAFVRVGALDEPSACPPDLYIFTASRPSWVVLPPDAKAFDGYYDSPVGLWSASALARRDALRPLIDAWQRERPPPSGSAG